MSVPTITAVSKFRIVSVLILMLTLYNIPRVSASLGFSANNPVVRAVRSFNSVVASFFAAWDDVSWRSDPKASLFSAANVHKYAPKWEKFETHVISAARTHRLEPEFLRAVIFVESRFNPYAVSPKGAQGLMQLMPGTARDLGVARPFDPAQNIAAGARYLRYLLDQFDGDVELALAGYNAGPAVVKYYQRVPPYRETRDYVRKVLGVYGIFKSDQLSSSRRERPI